MGQVAQSPLPPSQRIDAIDVLRGFALFGVLAINLHTQFRVTLFEQFIDEPPASNLDRITSIFLSYTFEFKSIAIFSFLFGVGLAVQFDRLGNVGHRDRIMWRRLAILLTFGLIHLIFIWNGDILTQYAAAGLITLPLLKFSTRTVLIGGLACLLFYFTLPFITLPFSFPDEAWLISHIAEARHIYGTGGFYDIFAFRLQELPEIAKLLIYIFPRTLALILLGVTFWRSGMIDKIARRSGLYSACAVALIGIGLLCEAHQKGAITLMEADPFLPIWAKMVTNFINEFGPLALALGYVLGIITLVQRHGTNQLYAPMAAVGRMAFSNYISQSLILSLLFYGIGFGLMGQVGATSGLALSVAIYTGQAVWSQYWLNTHRFGPLEWAWRSLTYGKRQQWQAAGHI